MKKLIMVLALSAVVGVANASKIEIVNKTNKEQKGSFGVIGAGICNEHLFEFSLKPGKSKTFDAANCCAHLIRTESGGRWGMSMRGVLVASDIRICGAREKFEIVTKRAGDISKTDIENVTGK